MGPVLGDVSVFCFWRTFEMDVKYLGAWMILNDIESWIWDYEPRVDTGRYWWIILEDIKMNLGEWYLTWWIQYLRAAKSRDDVSIGQNQCFLPAWHRMTSSQDVVLLSQSWQVQYQQNLRDKTHINARLMHLIGVWLVWHAITLTKSNSYQKPVHPWYIITNI